MASLWNQYYTEEELERARRLADEFGGMDNVVPIADKQVVTNNPIVDASVQTGEFAGIQPQGEYNPMSGANDAYIYVDGQRRAVPKSMITPTPLTYDANKLSGLMRDNYANTDRGIAGVPQNVAGPLMQNNLFTPEPPTRMDRIGSLFKDKLFNYDYMMGEVADPRFAGENRAYRALGALANLPLFGATPEMSKEFKKSLESNTQDIRKNLTDRAKAQAAAAGKSIYGKYGTTQLSNSLLNEVKSSVNKTFTLGDNASDEEIKGIADNAAKVLVQMESNPNFAGLSETQKRRAAILKAVEDFKAFGGSIF